MDLMKLIDKYWLESLILIVIAISCAFIIYELIKIYF